MASGKKVIADVGGDLNIESLQDTNTYKVDEKSLGIGISLCIPPFCYGMSSISGASANFGATNIDSNYASVTEQSGIKAGDDGFDINVRGNTDLVGAVIASSDKAVQDGKNSLVTSSLTSHDIKNKADYDANTVSLGGGLFSQTSPDESEEQREAKRNLIVSLVTGLAPSTRPPPIPRRVRRWITTGWRLSRSCSSRRNTTKQKA
ncbi:hemagglutinin repeat-containing protein [Pseudomonas trivialis]